MQFVRYFTGSSDAKLTNQFGKSSSNTLGTLPLCFINRGFTASKFLNPSSAKCFNSFSYLKSDGASLTSSFGGDFFGVSSLGVSLAACFSSFGDFSSSLEAMAPFANGVIAQNEYMDTRASSWNPMKRSALCRKGRMKITNWCFFNSGLFEITSSTMDASFFPWRISLITTGSSSCKTLTTSLSARNSIAMDFSSLLLGNLET
mmetsp:Transcript_3028/g.3757  ORF Transcript_3028/g.3757 Transcript_3028/m.3757 type:complete len:203 (-) Transcript_3028:1564-2172(-)